MSAKVTCLKCGASSSGTTDEIIAWDKAHNGACPAGVVTIIASGVSPDGVSWIVASKDGKLTLGVDPAHCPEEAHVSSDDGEHFHAWSDLPCKAGECRMEPQGEPSDAQVDAAEEAIVQAWKNVHASPKHLARAALRAAGAVGAQTTVHEIRRHDA